MYSINHNPANRKISTNLPPKFGMFMQWKLFFPCVNKKLIFFSFLRATKLFQSYSSKLVEMRYVKKMFLFVLMFLFEHIFFDRNLFIFLTKR